MRADFLKPTADDPMPPYMTPGERHLLEQAVAGRHAIVEYGVGGSTAIFARSGAERIVSVDTVPAWIARVAAHPDVAASIAAGRSVVVPVDIGPVGSFGRPRDRARYDQWPAYARAPWAHVDPGSVDFVFVDGRFRLAAMLTTLLLGGPGVTILVHDFWDRPEYHEALRWVRVLAREGTMALLAPDPRAGDERGRLEQTLQAAQYDPR